MCRGSKCAQKSDSLRPDLYTDVWAHSNIEAVCVGRVAGPLRAAIGDLALFFLPENGQ